MGLYPLESKIQNYAWGTPGAISDFLGRRPSQEPEAELWMGAHPKAPSGLLERPDSNLLKLWGEAPQEFGGRPLPFLFKLLSAKTALSLQAHPTKAQAAEGFARENASGIPLDAFARNYKDANHKPELLCALTPFTALCGFSTPQEVSTRFKMGNLHLGPLADPLRTLERNPGQESLRALFAEIQALDTYAANVAIESLLASRALPAPRRELNQNLAALYDADRGILGSLMLNLVHLTPGEALYLPAGQLHAYVSGTGYEIMANSDNVLRGGLTPKHVDVPELMKTLVFAPHDPAPFLPSTRNLEGGNVVRRYQTSAEEFELLVLTIKSRLAEAQRGPHLHLVQSGRVVFQSGSQTVVAHKGEQVFCGAEADYTIDGDGEVVRAGLPL